jgi:tRNA threonylcarbamoyladenosine biosynthesis protein TsaB
MFGGVALLNDDILIAESRLNVMVTHSERLLTEINHTLTKAGLQINDIDVFAVAIGPGSFTGLRVGLSTVKGLIYPAKKQLVLVPTLEAFAWNLPFSPYQVCPILDARKKEVYSALFKWSGDKFIKTLNEQTFKIETLLEKITEPTIFLGEGSLLYKDKIMSKLSDNAFFAPQNLMAPLPSNFAYLGRLKALQGNFDDPIKATPLYLRRSEAELKKGE